MFNRFITRAYLPSPRRIGCHWTTVISVDAKVIYTLQGVESYIPYKGHPYRQGVESCIPYESLIGIHVLPVNTIVRNVFRCAVNILACTKPLRPFLGSAQQFVIGGPELEQGRRGPTILQFKGLNKVRIIDRESDQCELCGSCVHRINATRFVCFCVQESELLDKRTVLFTLMGLRTLHRS